MRFRIPLISVLLLLLVACASALDPITITPNNSSAQQLGGAYNSYKFANGDDTFEIFTVVPLTVQDIVYPLEFWYASYYLSWGCLILGILLASKKDHVPSIAITACGVLAFGGFLICTFMLPYTAAMYVDTQVVQNVLASGVSSGNNSVYITQVADYRASPVHAYICWGLSIAGFVEMVLGTLSFFGVFQSKGLAQAQRGNYVEQESGAEPETDWRKRTPRK